MRPALQPENIYAHPHTEQDVILWYNRALWHSIVSASRMIGMKWTMTNVVVFRPSFQSHMGRA